MKKITALLILLLSIPAYALWKHSDYNSTNTGNFRSDPQFSRTIDPDNLDNGLLNAAVFFVTNEERGKLGLPPLKHAIELETAAWHHSKRMAEKNFFSHFDRDPARKDPNKRGALAGISNPIIAENIATAHGIKIKPGSPVYPLNVSRGEFSETHGGPPIPYHSYLSFAEEIVKQWMNSPGHRANILSRNGVELGCGIYCFRDRNFNNIYKCIGTQKFQTVNSIISKEADDRLPF